MSRSLELELDRFCGSAEEIEQYDVIYVNSLFVICRSVTDEVCHLAPEIKKNDDDFLRFCSSFFVTAE